MPAAITDKYMKASSGTRPNPTTLASQKGIGDSLLTADDLTGWTTDTATTFVLYKVDSNNNEIINTRSEWKGIVSSNTITQLELTAGTDTIYPIGSPVIATPTADWADSLVEGLTVSQNQNGTLKDNLITTAMLQSNAVTTAKITDANVTTAKVADNAITAPKLATDAITLGYAENTAGFSTSSTTPVQVTDLTTTVTIPSGGRKVKITVWAGGVFNSVAATNAVLSLWDGTVGSGTKLAESYATSGTASAIVPCSVVAIVTPSAGSKTYNVGFARDNGVTATLRATSTSKAFILVEVI